MAPPRSVTTTGSIASSSPRGRERRLVRRVRATSRDAYERAGERVRRPGVAVTESNEARRAARWVDELIRVETPWGVPVEIVLGLATASEPFVSAMVPGGFLTKDIGIGHVVFITTDLDSAHQFATEVIGLRQSDRLQTNLGGIELSARFFQCNPRHHSLAIGAAPIELPQKLDYVMDETVSADNVGNAFDRA